MNTPLRTIRLGETPAPTHLICTPVCAMRIVATDEIGSHRRVTVILDGETTWIDVPPPGDSCWGDVPPVFGDYLLIAPDGSRSHQTETLFEAESRSTGPRPIGRPRVPLFTHFPS